MALVAAFLGWMFDGLEMGLFPLVARPALRDLLGSPEEPVIIKWLGVATAGFLVGAAIRQPDGTDQLPSLVRLREQPRGRAARGEPSSRDCVRNLQRANALERQPRLDRALGQKRRGGPIIG